MGALEHADPARPARPASARERDGRARFVDEIDEAGAPESTLARRASRALFDPDRDHRRRAPASKRTCSLRGRAPNAAADAA